MTTPEQLQSTLSLSGISCRIKGDKVLVEVCPYCGNDRWNMEISVEKGLADCWACRQPRPGRADTVIALLTGSDVHIPVSISERSSRKKADPAATVFASVPATTFYSAAQYLAKRGIDAAVADQFGLRVCTEEGHLLQNRIVLPAHDFMTGEVMGWVGRSYTNARPKYLATIPKNAPITGWRATNRRAPVVVVEGHFDGIAARRAGYSAAVLTSVDNPQAMEWVVRLPQDLIVVIALDGSAHDLAMSLYWRMFAVLWGGSRLRVLRLPEDQDPSSLGPDLLRVAVDHAIREDGTSIGRQSPQEEKS